VISDVELSAAPHICGVGLDVREDVMPGKVPQPHNRKKKGRSVQEKRAEKQAKKAGLTEPGLRLSGGVRAVKPHSPGGHG
jgi:hypothetical protein